MRGTPSWLWSVARETVQEWSHDHASRLAASLAFYTLLSMAPLVVLAVLVAGMAYGEDAARGHIAAQLTDIVGAQASTAIESVVEHAHVPGQGFLGSALGFAVLIFGASGMFIELRAAMREIWGIDSERDESLFDLVRQRFLSFALVMLIALLLLVATLVSAMLSALDRVGSEWLPGGALLWQMLNYGASFALISALFAALYKYVPPVQLPWREAWIGGGVAALLFVIGKSLLGLYLSSSSLSSAFGAASSLVALLVWIYYSAQIIFFGAELTQVLCRHRSVALGIRLPARPA